MFIPALFITRAMSRGVDVESGSRPSGRGAPSRGGKLILTLKVHVKPIALAKDGGGLHGTIIEPQEERGFDKKNWLARDDIGEKTR